MFDALAVSAEKALEEGLLAFEFELEEDDSNHGIPEAFLNHIDRTIRGWGSSCVGPAVIQIMEDFIPLCICHLAANGI